MDGQEYYLTLTTLRLCWTCHTLTHTVTYRCESVRKAVERVFGMLKKRFHILKLSLVGGDIEEIENMLFSCFIMHNMNLTDKGRMDLGHMTGDWCDHAPDTNRERRTLYDIVNGHTLLFNTIHLCSVLLAEHPCNPRFLSVLNKLCRDCQYQQRVCQTPSACHAPDDLQPTQQSWQTCWRMKTPRKPICKQEKTGEHC